MNTRRLLSFMLLCGLAWSHLLRAAERERPKVVTTFLPAYCFAVNVASNGVGDLAEVENLLPASVGPHEYQFSPGDLRKLSAADLVVMNGLGLDDWLRKAVRVAGVERNVRIVELAKGLDRELIHATEHASAAHASVNPHLWLDPLLAAHAVTNILKALRSIDPAHANAYGKNAAGYVARLHELDTTLGTAITGFKRREIVTYHNAFPYFARRYGLTLLGVVQEVAEVEPSPRHLKRLHELIREHNVPVVFTEPQSSKRLVHRIARDLGVAVDKLDTLETGPFTPTAYEDGMRRNLRVVEKHLK